MRNKGPRPQFNKQSQNESESQDLPVRRVETEQIQNIEHSAPKQTLTDKLRAISSSQDKMNVVHRPYSSLNLSKLLKIKEQIAYKENNVMDPQLKELLTAIDIKIFKEPKNALQIFREFDVDGDGNK